MQNDANTTLAKLKELQKKFSDERDWTQFHDPKNLAEAMLIECGELLELFLWKDVDKARNVLESDKRIEVENELADVMIYLLEFAENTGIDISQAVFSKMQKNAEKYPAKKVKGSAKKYTEY